MIPVDILPVFKSPAVQVLTFYGGMPAEGMEKDITSRMERWGRSGEWASSPRIPFDRRREHCSRLLPGRCRPQRSADAGQLAGSGFGPESPAGHASSGRLAVRPDELDADRPGGSEQRDRERVDALRRRSLRGPEHDHGSAWSRGPGRLWRQGPRGHALHEPRQDAGTRSFAARRDEGDGQLQRLPAGGRRQVRRDRLRHRLELDVPAGRPDGRYPVADRPRERRVHARRGDPQG